MEKIVASPEELEQVSSLVKDLETILQENDVLRKEDEKLVSGAFEVCSSKEEQLHQGYLSQIDEINACSRFNKDLFEKENERFSAVAATINDDSLSFQEELSSLMAFVSEVK